MSYDGQTMKDIIMKRAGRKVTSEAFVCCGNLNERTWLQMQGLKACPKVAGTSTKPSNKQFLSSRAEKLELGKLRSWANWLAAGVCHVH